MQMATPLNKLPLKTTRPDTSDLEDPMIQNVLKEFEDEMAAKQQSPGPEQQQYTVNMHPPSQQQQAYQQQPSYPSQPPYQSQGFNQSYNQFNQNPKKLINMDLVKKTAVIAIIVFLLQNYNIISILLSRLPEVATKHITGKEFLINFALIFIIFYALMYLDVL